MYTQDFDDITLAKLARELVMNIRGYKDIFDDYGIDEEDYYEIQKNPFFIKVKEQYTIEWNSAVSTKERVSLGGLAYVEQLMPIVTRRAMSDDANLTAANDVLKTISKISGIGETASEKGSAERFVITINMGADTETYDKPIAVEPATPAIVEGVVNGKVKRKGKTSITDE